MRDADHDRAQLPPRSPALRREPRYWMLALLERQAVRLRHYRWLLFAAKVASIGSMLAAIHWLRDPFFWIVHVASPVLMWAWGLLCLTTWFSPSGPSSFRGRCVSAHS